MEVLEIANAWRGQSGRIYSNKGISPTLPSKGRGNTGLNSPLVLVSPKSINTPSKSMKNTSSTKTIETSPKSTQANSQTSTYSAEEFLVKAGVSPESVAGLTMSVEICGFNFLAYLEQNSPNSFLQKMLKDYSPTMGATLWKEYAKNFATADMQSTLKF